MRAPDGSNLLSSLHFLSLGGDRRTVIKSALSFTLSLGSGSPAISDRPGSLAYRALSSVSDFASRERCKNDHSASNTRAMNSPSS